jgi:hypothetical protein
MGSNPLCWRQLRQLNVESKGRKVEVPELLRDRWVSGPKPDENSVSNDLI